MKRIVRYILLAAVSMAALSCEDFDLRDSFLQKPPSVDITIDTVFSNAEYARRVLWNSYDKLPFGLPITGRKTVMNKGTVEGLTDLAHTAVNDSGERQVYYPGRYSADMGMEVHSPKSTPRLSRRTNQRKYMLRRLHAAPLSIDETCFSQCGQ